MSDTVKIAVGNKIVEMTREEAGLPAAPDDATVSAQVRRKRDDLLAQSDWVVTKAVEQNAVDGFGIQVPMNWIKYRQALRDIPSQAGFPYTVTWPQEP